MECAFCKAEVPKFCTSCGSPLSLRPCPACNMVYQTAKQACPICGHDAKLQDVNSSGIFTARGLTTECPVCFTSIARCCGHCGMALDVKQCPSCKNIIDKTDEVCACCGYEFLVSPKVWAHRDGVHHSPVSKNESQFSSGEVVVLERNHSFEQAQIMVPQQVQLNEFSEAKPKFGFKLMAAAFAVATVGYIFYPQSQPRQPDISEVIQLEPVMPQDDIAVLAASLEEPKPLAEIAADTQAKPLTEIKQVNPNTGNEEVIKKSGTAKTPHATPVKKRVNRSRERERSKIAAPTNKRKNFLQAVIERERELWQRCRGQWGVKTGCPSYKDS